MESKILTVCPSVYAVGDEYQICALVNSECTMWVEVEGKCYFDHSNGILRSGRFLHIAHVPMTELDGAKKYTVYLRRINERKPYFTDFGNTESSEFTFKPCVKKEKYNIINLADAHSLVDEPIRSGSFFGDELDLLVMNGDIPNHCGNIEYFKAIYLISGGITKGAVPCIFSRGNHDMRGIYAEQLADYTPTMNGRSYYTFKVGPIWGVVLDAGEDKADTCPEYGHTVCCSAFRDEEDRFLDEVIEKGEYKNAGIRLIICHHPFTFRLDPPFDIEQERYAGWAKKLQKISPTAMLSGHLHEMFAENPGGVHDTFGAPCPVICTSLYGKNPGYHCSGAVTLSSDGIDVVYHDSKGEIKGEVRLDQ